MQMHLYWRGEVGRRKEKGRGEGRRVLGESGEGRRGSGEGRGESGEWKGEEGRGERGEGRGERGEGRGERGEGRVEGRAGRGRDSNSGPLDDMIGREGRVGGGQLMSRRAVDTLMMMKVKRSDVPEGG